MSCNCESRCLVDGGKGRRSRRFAISALMRSRRSLLAPFVDLPWSNLVNMLAYGVRQVYRHALVGVNTHLDPCHH